MKAFFEGIGDLFVNYLFKPYDTFRFMENWWASNSVNWIFVIIGFLAMLYWLNQIQVFNKLDQEDKTSTSHSYL
jgi:predicted negative regulator of RcsB-dependent stress response